MPTAATCPSCTGTLGISTWTPGRQLRCPRCKAIFQLGPAPGRTQMPPATTPSPPAVRPTPAVPTSAPLPPTTPPVVATTLTPATPAAAPTAPVAPRGLSRVALILGILGLLVAFVGGTLALTWHLANQESRPQPEPPLAQNPTPPSPVPPQPQPMPRPVIDPQPVPVPVPVVEPPPMPMPNPSGRRLPPELQARVNSAIDRGLAYLQSQQKDDGSFQGTIQAGSAFLGGLTLLECGVSKDDPRVRLITEKARRYVPLPEAVGTYDVALALLYLDRLGDPSDRERIQTLALRLLGGQEASGGWGYRCETLMPETERAFLTALRQTRPQFVGELILRDAQGTLRDLTGKVLDEATLDATILQKVTASQQKLERHLPEIRPFPRLLTVPSLLSQEIALPGYLPPKRPTDWRVPVPRRPTDFGADDNSNTQFAALGLWVASRHDIPCERALALLAQRCRTQQSPEGGWSYRRGEKVTAPMTCAGLLALAISHGIKIQGADERREDPQIQRGLHFLAEQLDQGDQDLARNLYFLWSLERVAVMFNLEKVGDRDWYAWGAEQLVISQAAEGAWNLNGYHGSVPVHDTCFALLFLRKANLVQDLSHKLERVLDIKSLRRD